MAVNLVTLEAAIKAAFVAAGAVESPALDAIASNLATAIRAAIMSASVAVVTTCPAGAGTGTGTVT